MTPGAFIGAVLVVLATTMPAHARTEVMGGGPSHRGVSHRPVESTVLPDDDSNVAKTEAAVSPAGAIYDPFADASNSNGPHEGATKPSSNADHADVSLTIIAALAGVAVFVHILRCAMHAH
jgi:hypothetical protein